MSGGWVFVLGVSVSVGASVPNIVQLVRSLRVRNAQGWSSSLVFAWFVSYVAWCVYTVIVGEPLLAIANSIGAVAMGVVLFFLVREGKVGWGEAVGWGVLGIVVLGVGIMWVPAVLPVVMTGVNVVVMFPQIVALIRADSADGVSVVFFVLMIVLGMGRIVYSFLVGKPLIAFYDFFGVPWSAWVVVRVRRLQSRNRKNLLGTSL